MIGIKRLLRYIEGDNPKCILCSVRKSDITLSGDGVGICSSCYKKYLDEAVKDYYDTNSKVRRLFAPFVYEGEMRRALHELKFSGCSAYAEPIGKIVADALPGYYLYSDYDMILPVPLHPRRLADRGYNQAELIAVPIAEKIGVPIYDDVIFRIKETKHQMTLSRALRKKNVEGAFFADRTMVEGKRILLIDDIYTAGATVQSCADELFKKGASEVSAIVVCANFIKENKNEITISIPTVIKDFDY